MHLCPLPVASAFHVCLCLIIFIWPGDVLPLPHVAFPLQHACVDAFYFLQRASHIGKVVVTIPGFSSPHAHSAGAYIVSGGTGALGLLAAQWLVEQGAGGVSLLSRSGKVAAGAKAFEEWLEGPDASSSVTIQQCDVADEHAVRAIVADGAARVPVRGVLHCA